MGVSRSPGAVALGAGSVWVANTLDGTVSRIDPRTSVVTSTIEVGESPSGIAAGDDAVWVSTEYGASIVRIDPETNVATRIPIGGRPAGLAVAPAGVLVSVRPGGLAHAGRTLSVALDEVDSIDTYDGNWEVLD